MIFKSIQAIITRASSAVIQLIFQFLIMFLLSQSEAGIIFSLLATMIFFSVLSRQGRENLIVKNFREYKRNANTLNSFATYSIQHTAFTALCLTVFMLLAVNSYGIPHSLSVLTIATFASSLIPFSLLWIYSAIYKAMNYGIIANFFEVGLIPIVVLVFLGLAYIFQSSVTIEIILILYSLSCWVALLIIVFFNRNLSVEISVRYIQETISLQKFLKRYKDEISRNKYYLLLALINYFFMWFPLVLLAYLADSSQVSVYNFSFRLISIMFLIASAINSIFINKLVIGDICVKHNYNIRLISRILLIFVTLSNIFGWFAVPLFLDYFDNGYEGSVDTLIILTTGISMYVLFGGYYTSLMVSGRENAVFLINLLGAILSSIVLIVLIFISEINEVNMLAISISCGYAFMGMCSFYYYQIAVRKKLNNLIVND